MADHVGCWREYLRRCIEKRTFIVPDGVGNSDNIIARLRQLIDMSEYQALGHHTLTCHCDLFSAQVVYLLQ